MFHLKSRALHVHTEARRVLDFQKVCLAASSKDMRSNKHIPSDDEKILKSLGEIMNQSHSSCREQYECSSKELDFLTDDCRRLGAYG